MRELLDRIRSWFVGRFGPKPTILQSVRARHRIYVLIRYTPNERGVITYGWETTDGVAWGPTFYSAEEALWGFAVWE